MKSRKTIAFLILASAIAVVLFFQNCAKNPNLSQSVQSSTFSGPTFEQSLAPTYTATAGQNLSIDAPATGTNLTYVWLKSGQALTSGTNGYSFNSAGSTLNIQNVTASDAGTYTLVVSNSAGSTSATFTIVVNSSSGGSATCPAQTITWNSACQGALSATAAGSSATVTNSAAGYSGSATYACSSTGAWTANPTNATCSAGYKGYIDVSNVCPRGTYVMRTQVVLGALTTNQCSSIGSACGSTQTVPLNSCITGTTDSYYTTTTSCGYSFGSTIAVCSVSLPMLPESFSLTQLGVTSSSQCPSTLTVCP